jgi:hypothetical protein
MAGKPPLGPDLRNSAIPYRVLGFLWYYQRRRTSKRLLEHLDGAILLHHHVSFFLGLDRNTKQHDPNDYLISIRFLLPIPSCSME